VETKWLTCNGRQLRKLAQASLAHLEENYRKVNELNVFPVPDGDTGTNMLLTMRAAVRRLEDNDELHVGRVAHELSYGALMGARGNSGVILSQIWRGFARSLKDSRLFDAAGLAAALREASDTAYNGVMRPVEGTILTVAREAAEEAAEAQKETADLRFVLASMVERSRQSLARTPDLLPVLKRAGVVDAGGQGLVYLLEGMLQYVRGEALEALRPMAAEVPAQALAAPDGGLENPYDVQFLLMGDRLNVAAVREAIDAMGDSTLVVGDDKTIKVHIHVKDPGVPLSYGISLGRIADVVVENMQLQMEEIIGDAPAAAPTLDEEPARIEPGQIGVVAVSPGDGLTRIFRSLGAAGVVDGGQSNNPSTEEIYRIVERVPTDRVIILPNNKNIILAAQAVRDLSDKQVLVVPTRTVPQGICALLALDQKGDIAAAAEAMESACDTIASGEITVATRSVVLDGIEVAEGQTIGLVNDRLCVANADLEAVLTQVLAEMEVGDREIISLYYGEDVTAEDAEALVKIIREQYPDVEVEVLPGGQAIYHYILGAE
jgi:hypothetical protein